MLPTRIVEAGGVLSTAAARSGSAWSASEATPQFLLSRARPARDDTACTSCRRATQDRFVDDSFRGVVKPMRLAEVDGGDGSGSESIETILMGSNRRFGTLLVAACVIVWAFGAWHGSAHAAWLVAAAFFLLITLLMPRILLPLKNLWMKLGGLLQMVVSPILLGLFYFLGMVPIGLIMRMLGKDPLRLRPHGKTYWVERKPPGPEPDTMAELF
jgi:Saxitoxin biosynthesis operon protein SxtJ